MATATQDMIDARPTVARGTVTDALVTKFKDVYDPKDGWIAQYNVEREDEIELLGVALAGGIDALFLGDAGVGKTWMIELQLRTLLNAGKALGSMDLFNTLMFKEMSANDVLGPPNIDALKRGVIERMIEGYLPTARIAYLDEFFKSSPTVINALLDAMANRVIKVGGKLISLKQLLVIYASSNELPDREDLYAARDRWGITKFVKPVRTSEGRKQVMEIQDTYQAGGSTIDMTDAPFIELDDVATIRAEVNAVLIPDPVREALADAQEMWEQAGHLPSQRRMGQILRAAKARAWTRGRGEVTTDDLVIAQHMAWNHPDHADSARKIIMEFANQFTKRASRMREALEPITTELSECRKEISDLGATAPPDELLERLFKVQRDLRRLEREAKQEITKGRDQAQDVTELERVRADIRRNNQWVEKALLNDDDDLSSDPGEDED
jgi:MoxR-like ATPase